MFSAMLADLRAAHGALAVALAEMEGVTRDSAADRLRYSRARWRLSNASLFRRALWQRIHHALAGCATGAEARTLADLQEADCALLRDSADHVRHWTAGSVEAKWDQYCAASRDMRWKIKAGISAEQRLLYPLLERASGAARSSRAA
jgi:hypothetical protein